ncbi:hypothetical protein CALVIDRAFT_535733 [Calocera viscosa TUFC12733]|uniref:Non-haem dioxygenase N-terminal domain-containing protein n=1 Tax=Calocera viscosa (strain TUFC12733) TaxID=1330018 RepID=A0A167NW22_CALVF|nr:hypothetical protein CALVIDRAFT_535733 [Calocera viscosa TUFC12733]
MSTLSIPVLSLDPPPAPAALAQSLEAHGFLQLSHPAPALLDLAGKMFASSRRFFEHESGEEKERVRRVKPVNSGWVAPGAEKLDLSGSEELKECVPVYFTCIA